MAITFCCSTSLRSSLDSCHRLLSVYSALKRGYLVIQISKLKVEISKLKVAGVMLTT